MNLEDEVTPSTPSDRSNTVSYLHSTECNGRQRVLIDRGHTEGEGAVPHQIGNTLK